MEKLEYDSLHKFFVSLGLIFISLPFVTIFFILNCNVPLLTQKEFDALSIYSQNRLQQQGCMTQIFFNLFPLISFILFIIGILLISIGIKNWKKVQNNLDALVEAERIKRELDTARMKQSEVLVKTTEEVKESENLVTHPTQSSIIKHMNIEEKYFSNAVSSSLKRRYFFNRNVKIGKIEYDAIAVSKTNNTDLIYEIKVWKQPRTIPMLRTTIERLYKAAVNYKTLKDRNFKCILVIVTSNENIDVMHHWVESLSHEKSEYDFSKFEIQYVAEETL